MRNIKTFVQLDDGSAVTIDTIEHDGALWLVPYWIATQNPNMQKPARLIRLESLEKLADDFLETGVTAYRLHVPVPKAAIDGQPLLPTDPPLVVIEAPDLIVRRV